MKKMKRSGERADNSRADSAWSRFERTVDVVMKAKPKHRPAKAEKPTKTRGRRTNKS